MGEHRVTWHFGKLSDDSGLFKFGLLQTIS